MSKSPIKFGTIAHKFQIDFFFHKLELILANPLAKVALSLTIGSQKAELNSHPKASKETTLNELISVTATFYEDPKKGVYQEKFATVEVFLSNSKVSNSIGFIKFDLSPYLNGSETHEIMNLSKSVEYQGKIAFTIKTLHLGVEESGNASNIEPNDSVSQQDFSDVGKNERRSATPTGKTGRIANNQGGKKLLQVVDRMMMKPIEPSPPSDTLPEKDTRKSKTPTAQAKKNFAIPFPILSNTANIVKEYSGGIDEKKKLEKALELFKVDKNKTDALIIEKDVEKKKEIEGLRNRLGTLETENNQLRLEISVLQKDLEKERSALHTILGAETPSLETYANLEIEALHAKNQELRKQNERVFTEKIELEKALNEERRKALEMDVERKRERVNYEEKIGILNDVSRKQEKDIKELIAGLNREQKDGLAEKILENSKKIELNEAELSKKDQEIERLKSIIDDKNRTISNKSDRIQQLESEFQGKENELLERKTSFALKSESLTEKQNFLEGSYLETKQKLADIINLIFEKSPPDVIEEVDKMMSS